MPSVLASWPVSPVTARTHVPSLGPVPKTQSALFMTLCRGGPWPARAETTSRAKGMFAATKLVRAHGQFIIRVVPPYENQCTQFPALPQELGCDSDQECPDNLACQFRECSNPCSLDNPCSSLATCFVQNHKQNCRCPHGMSGDPFRECVPSKAVKFNLRDRA